MKTAGSQLTPIGYIPKVDDLDLGGLSIPNETMEALLSIDKDAWTEEARDIEKFFKTFGSDLPAEIKNQLKGLQARLADS
jgi:phosphoenolpyruvate carboxykinase (GTP)